MGNFRYQMAGSSKPFGLFSYRERLHSNKEVRMDIFWFVIIYSLFVPREEDEEEPYDESLDEFEIRPF